MNCPVLRSSVPKDPTRATPAQVGQAVRADRADPAWASLGPAVPAGRVAPLIQPDRADPAVPADPVLPDSAPAVPADPLIQPDRADPADPADRADPLIQPDRADPADPVLPDSAPADPAIRADRSDRADPPIQPDRADPAAPADQPPLVPLSTVTGLAGSRSPQPRCRRSNNERIRRGPERAGIVGMPPAKIRPRLGAKPA
ncbi:hypothetical protein NJB1604_44990 [Mycobacterium marinum]|nr:hypothetical protein NJB1604_44990 [Mycobacterium marinum]